MRTLEYRLCALEGAHRCVVYPSGLAACAGALLAFLAVGGHCLIPDNVYGPTRAFASRFLKRYGVETTFYDPLVGAGIEPLVRPKPQNSARPPVPTMSISRSGVCGPYRSA